MVADALRSGEVNQFRLWAFAFAERVEWVEASAIETSGDQKSGLPVAEVADFGLLFLGYEAQVMVQVVLPVSCWTRLSGPIRAR